MSLWVVSRVVGSLSRIIENIYAYFLIKKNDVPRITQIIVITKRPYISRCSILPAAQHFGRGAKDHRVLMAKKEFVPGTSQSLDTAPPLPSRPDPNHTISLIPAKILICAFSAP